MTKTSPRYPAPAALLLLGCAFATGAPGQPPAESRSAPDAASLERLGVRIGRIDIVVDNVFDTSNPQEDKALYRWANRVHVTTRESVVESILLIEPGSRFERRLLDESARLLRARGFVADASVTAGSYDTERGTVDVEVWVRDAWTLEPDIKLSRSGGENEYGFGVVEDNLLGTGKSLTLSFTKDVDRDQTFIGYSDPNVRGSRVRLDTLIADASDGHRVAFSAGRPFFAFDTRWSVAGSLLDEQRTDQLYALGEVFDEFRHDTRQLTIGGGLSRGFENGRSVRWRAGYTYDEQTFAPSPQQPLPLLLPDDRKLIYPWVGVEIVADDFRQMSDLNDMGRTEDIALGLDFEFRVGFARDSFGADRDAEILSASLSKGWEPGGPGRLLLVDFAAGARREGDTARNAIVSTTARYFHRNLGNGRFSVSLAATTGNALDAERQILIGGDNGLRGYPIRYQSGEKSAALTLEQRFYTDWYPFRLIRVGYAVFFDIGRVWGPDARGAPTLGTLRNVGAGLRLSSPRSSGRSIVHVDLAFPLDGDPTIDDVQLIIEKKASF